MTAIEIWFEANPTTGK